MVEGRINIRVCRSYPLSEDVVEERRGKRVEKERRSGFCLI